MNRQGIFGGNIRVKMSRSARGTGFTLIELLVVVAIIAILAAVAYPSYTAYITKSKRKAAEGCLSQYANYMERYYTTNLRYDQDPAGNKLTTLPGLDCAASQQTGNYYSYSFAAGSPAQSSYVVQATPINEQLTRDTLCGTLTLNNTGTRTKSGSAATVAMCW